MSIIEIRSIIREELCKDGLLNSKASTSTILLNEAITEHRVCLISHYPDLISMTNERFFRFLNYHTKL